MPVQCLSRARPTPVLLGVVLGGEVGAKAPGQRLGIGDARGHEGHSAAGGAHSRGDGVHGAKQLVDALHPHTPARTLIQVDHHERRARPVDRRVDMQSSPPGHDLVHEGLRNHPTGVDDG
jgi:hypothetical protein